MYKSICFDKVIYTFSLFYSQFVAFFGAVIIKPFRINLETDTVIRFS